MGKRQMTVPVLASKRCHLLTPYRPIATSVLFSANAYAPNKISPVAPIDCLDDEGHSTKP